MPKISLPKLKQLKSDYPDIHFKSGDTFYWSAKDNCIYYEEVEVATPKGLSHLLHELGHALQGHTRYESGIQLLKMESEAWSKAQAIAPHYGVSINDQQIEDCLNSYRDWLHARSTCPLCSNVSVEISESKYRCFNCRQLWTVPVDQRSRHYRLKVAL